MDVKVSLLEFNVTLTSYRHIATVPACRSDTLTNMLPHWNTMP